MTNNIKAALLLIIGVVFGFVGGSYYTKSGVSVNSNNLNTSTTTTTEKQNQAIFYQLNPITSASGIVIGINGSVISVEFSDYLVSQNLHKTIDFIISPDTKIIRLIPKTLDEIKKEVAAYVPPANPTIIDPVNPFMIKPNEQPGTLNDIKLGQTVSVSSSESLADKASVSPLSISISGAIPPVKI